MKMKCWTILAVMISTSLLADQATTPPAVAPAVTSTNTSVPEAPAHPAPAPKPAKKKVVAKPVKKTAPTELKTVPLVPGPAIVAANNVNVRGQAKLKSEVITRMTNREPVTVIEEVHLARSGPDEPSAWAKIVLPAKAHAWVHTSYIDANKTVIPKTLNLRGGPGENYSILGTLQKGDAVKEVRVKDKWMEIESPANAYAFMAAQYLSQDPTMMAAANPIAVTTTPEVATNTTDVPPANLVMTNETVEPTNEVATTETPLVEEPPPPRIVQREGMVRGTFSIQAPTTYELISLDNNKPINYLYTASPNLDLSRYKGLHIIVTGEEGLDERWKNTPIITIHKIQVLD
jgi:uncharacterized protein YgiM (DUF1202 family)